MARRDNEKAAKLLVEAALETDTKVAERHGITTRTLQNYRAALGKDPELSRIFAEHLALFLRRSWADELEQALRETIRTLVEHIKGQPEKTPESLEAITKAFSALGEVAVAREVLGVATDRQDAAVTASTSADGRGAAESLPN